MEAYQLTIREAGNLLKRREISAKDLTQSVLDRIEAIEPLVRSFITINQSVALRYAEKADQLIQRGEMTPLTGIPMQVKDLICTKEFPTTCASKMLEEFVPIYDATVVESLNRSGAVLIGKGNMDEFAMGSSTENSAFHPTHNPWDLGRVPGGSSGGGAAAVSASECLFALGSDTGGSIRQPAALCGVTGMKPTYGLVSRFGLVAFASSLDQIGPLTKDVEDTAIVLSAIAKYDPKDSTSIQGERPDYSQSVVNNVKGLRLGLPTEYFGEGVDPEIEKAVKQAASILEREGAIVEECSLPLTRYALAVYYIIAPSECSSNLARYDGVKYGFSAKEARNVWEALEETRGQGFGPEVKRRIMLGTYALSSGYYDDYYLKALKVRTMIKEEFDKAFGRFDALITPTSPTVAFKLGSKTEDPVTMYRSDFCTIPVNIAGIPSMSIPCGFDGGLPIGMQLIGKALSEDTLIRIGYTYQQQTDWHRLHPDL
jgi:aspartyl-tRNA(Asn)/glutamyl-tRNA(Gln) amidotransferase subunit A